MKTPVNETRNLLNKTKKILSEDVSNPDDKVIDYIFLGQETMAGEVSLVKYKKNNKIHLIVTDVFYGGIFSTEDDSYIIREMEKYSTPLNHEDIKKILELLK